VREQQQALLSGAGKNWQARVQEVFGEIIRLPVPAGFEAAEGAQIEVCLTAEKESDACLIPLECLAEDEGGSYVMVLSGKKARRQQVECALRSETQAAISSGLQPGEEVLYFPEQYREGQRLEGELFF
jgi:hypothetical protein